MEGQEERDQRPVFIYGLIDPTTNDLRYVGQALNVPRRMRELWASRAAHLRGTVYGWLQELYDAGLRPELEILDITSPESADDVEMAWMLWAWSEEHPLVNRGMQPYSRSRRRPRKQTEEERG